MLFLDQIPSLFEYHKNTKNLNLQALTIWITRERFIIVPNTNRSRIPTILEINRISHAITEHVELSEDKYNDGKPHFFSCMIGILDIYGKKAILLAEEVCIVGAIGQRDLFRVVKPIYLFYNPQDKKALSEQEAGILLNTTAIFEQGMYFSFTYDLALRMNSQPGVDTEIKGFNWAFHLQGELQKFDKMWRLSMIQGFVGRLQLHINGVKMYLILISRRAMKKGGTHTYDKGLDREGNAGNFVQTEQIIIMKEHYFSFILTRGTVPLFWNEIQTGYGFSSVKFEQSLDDNYSSFKNHLKIVQRRGDYKNIFLLNVLTSSKEQKRLIENYQFLVRKLSKQPDARSMTNCDVWYAYFDIHAKCPNKQYVNLNSFLEKELERAIDYCGFTALHFDRTERKVSNLSQQTGVFRVNCFTCVDRSNIVQSRIAALKLMQILRYLEIEINEFKNGLDFFSHNSAFSNLYRNLWADNGDALSKQYTGTGSTESFAVRKGKLSYLTILDHGMKSIFRAIRNIRNEDEKKQEAICFIVGEEMPGKKLPHSESPMETTTCDRDEYKYYRMKEGNS